MLQATDNQSLKLTPLSCAVFMFSVSFNILFLYIALSAKLA